MTSKNINHKRFTEYVETSSKAKAQMIAKDLKARNITHIGGSRKITISTRVLTRAGKYVVYYRKK